MYRLVKIGHVALLLSSLLSEFKWLVLPLQFQKRCKILCARTNVSVYTITIFVRFWNRNLNISLFHPSRTAIHWLESWYCLMEFIAYHFVLWFPTSSECTHISLERNAFETVAQSINWRKKNNQRVLIGSVRFSLVRLSDRCFQYWNRFTSLFAYLFHRLNKLPSITVNSHRLWITTPLANMSPTQIIATWRTYRKSFSAVAKLLKRIFFFEQCSRLANIVHLI